MKSYSKLIFGVLLTAVIACHAFAQMKTPAPDYIRTSIYVPGHDGTKLAVDVYRPSANGQPTNDKLPAIYTQNRTTERGAAQRAGVAIEPTIQYFVTHGYIWVSQDRRGSGSSFGTQKGFITLDDRLDGKAVIDWIAKQAWSNGKVGTIGCSNQGESQYAIAETVPSPLKTMIPNCADPNFFNVIFPNGVSALPLVAMGQRTAPQQLTPGIPVDEDQAPGYVMATAAAQEHLANVGFLGQYQLNMRRDQLNEKFNYRPGIVDSPIMYSKELKASGIQMYHWAGWFDASPGGQIQAYNLWGGKIIIGPWTHCQSTATNTANGAGRNFPPLPNNFIDLNAESLRWLDYTLKGADNGISNEPPVRYYTINAPAGDEWRYAPSFPLPNQTTVNYYLDGGKSGSIGSSNDGSLNTNAPQSTTAKDDYKVDLSVSPFAGKYDRLYRYWSGDMAQDTDKKGLTYTTSPLALDTEITGTPLIHLWVTSSNPDGDFFAFVEEVDPQGVSHYVTDGVIRGSWRKTSTPPWGDLGIPYHRGFTEDLMPLSASDPAELVFDTYPTSYIFRKGNRLRLTIIGASIKQFQMPDSLANKPSPTISLYRDAKHPSFVSLPIIPPNSSFIKGTANINTAKLKYDGPAELYVSSKAVYLHAGGKWLNWQTAKTKSGKNGTDYDAKGDFGAIKISLQNNSAKLSGNGIKFN